ncbi:MAG: sulfatase-like hydrolase/transferase [Planctomycetota bacterium]
MRTLLACCLITLASLTSSRPLLADEERPNVLVIVLDDAGYHDFGFMGNALMATPNIDRLAASGMVFLDAHLSGTTCSPSRAGLMTGRYQQRFGHHNNVPPHGCGMDPGEKTLGDTMRAGGYRTYYVGKWHLGATDPYHPNNRGFDEFHGLLEGSRSYFPDEKHDTPGDDRAIQRNGEHVRWDGYLTDHLTDAAIELLNQPREQPFAMVLSYTAPHTPMHAKPEHLAKFADHPRPKLAAMTWSADEGIGRVLGKLEELGERDNTLVFFLSDNGGALASGADNSPLKGYKGTEFEGGQRTPFIVSWPGKIEAGSSFDGLVSALDILATAAAAAGVTTPVGKPLDGVDLLPFALGEQSGDPHPHLFWRRSREHSVRAGDFKLIGHDQAGWRLYNVAEDIGETRDLTADQPELAASLRAKLDDFESQLVEPQWSESEQWEDVKAEMYRAWLRNKEPRYTDPWGMRRWREANRD